MKLGGNVLTAKVIKLYWWSPHQNPRTLASLVKDHSRASFELLLASGSKFSNFGDEFSPLLLQELTGHKISWAPPSKADVFGIGSILQSLPNERAVAIWGSGFRSVPSEKAIDTLKIHIPLLVRGPMTREYFSDEGVLPSGDPGIYIRNFYDKKPPRSLSPLYLPHFAELSHRKGRKVISDFRASGFQICLPNQSPVAVAEAISRSSFLVTSSLHGRIFADSLGVPVVSTSSSHEPIFKYLDYCKSIETTFESHSPEKILTMYFEGSVLNLFSPLVPEQKMHKLSENILEAAKKLTI